MMVKALPSLLLLGGCPAPQGDPWPEEDLGRIDDVIDDVDQTVWPGVVDDNGVRTVRRLNGFFQGTPSAYWFAGFASRQAADVFWFCREGDEACPFDENGVIDRDHTIGNPVFGAIPGDTSFSPFWLTWKVSVPDDYEPNDLKSAAGIEAAAADGLVSVAPNIFDHRGEIGRDMTIMHCLLTLEGTELEYNPAPLIDDPDTMAMEIPPEEGWNKGYRLQFYDFTRSEGVFAPAVDTESTPLMRTADIFVFFRQCGSGSTSPACGHSSADLGAVSERGVEYDFTGDGDKSDNNNIISGFPRLTNEDPLDPVYSPLWRVQKVEIPVENDDLVVLVDSNVDQQLSDVKTPQRMRELVDGGIVLPPTVISEADSVDSIMANSGTTFFNCPSQVADQ